MVDAELTTKYPTGWHLHVVDLMEFFQSLPPHLTVRFCGEERWHGWHLEAAKADLEIGEVWLEGFASTLRAGAAEAEVSNG